MSSLSNERTKVVSKFVTFFYFQIYRNLFCVDLGADLLMDMFGTEESGYGSQSNTSTANSDPLANLDPLDRLGFEESFFKEKKEQELFDAAVAGQNLLGMVDEGPSRGYDDEIKKARESFQGSALMDFFVDPTQLFASERHPALQEVLKVLSRSKMHRGISAKNTIRYFSFPRRIKKSILLTSFVSVSGWKQAQKISFFFSQWM